MGLLEFVLIAVFLGLVVWLVNTYTPIPQPIKTLILVVVIVALVVILLRATGLFMDVPIPRLR